MSEKVRISKETDVAIKELRKAGYTDYQLVFNLCRGIVPHDAVERIQREDVDTIIRALYIGYEIEATPEEQAIQWCIKRNCIAPGYSPHDVVMAVKSILERKGVNA